MTSRERQYLLDILLAAEEARSFVAGHSDAVLQNSALVRAAVLHCLTVIGEAATRLLKVEELGPLPDLPWRKMADLRNVVVHEYDAVDLDRIWRIIEAELPAVIAALAPLFPERPRP